MRVTSLRWWTVLLPTVAIILVDYARHKLIAGFTHPWQDEAVLLLGVLLVGFATSQLLFQRIEHSQRREREAEMLRRIGMEVTSNLDLEAVLNSILLRGRQALDADCLGIAMAGAARRELILQTREAAAPRTLPALPDAGFPWETATAGEEREQIVALPVATGGGCPSCHSCLALPLRMGSQLLGHAGLAGRRGEGHHRRRRTGLRPDPGGGAVRPPLRHRYHAGEDGGYRRAAGGGEQAGQRNGHRGHRPPDNRQGGEQQAWLRCCWWTTTSCSAGGLQP